MDKFQNKYRIPSARAQWWDYANTGAYFITICSQNREHYFGHIADNQFIASESGKIAEKIWNEIPVRFQYIELGAFVVMPNHIHGILIISHVSHVETRLIASLQSGEQSGGFAGTKNPMLNKNISHVIRWYKGSCTFNIRKINRYFQWQSLFYDHIIRNDAEYERIVNYINTNPENWGTDKLYKSEEL
ncbi:MAG: hypothetical protein A2X12_09270 [Bacteroidetes bacterium GWE2_29_8]|nr:MAG: hypothetical protein A2X12_09270 [Bacteroidetes bacterium GWE2_29_8]OFY18070.1 MAG: hypothetical protein A2X02_05760 [Bacteroidetes bacterium GWF2_29_10]